MVASRRLVSTGPSAKSFPQRLRDRQGPVREPRTDNTYNTRSAFKPPAVQTFGNRWAAVAAAQPQRSLHAMVYHSTLIKLTSTRIKVSKVSETSFMVSGFPVQCEAVLTSDQTKAV